MKYLSDNIIPNIYNLYFDFDIKNDKFKGYNIINIEIKKNTNNIQFHCSNLNIENIIFNKITQKDINYDTENEILTINLTETINVGKYILEIYFNGIIADSGLIKKKYNNDIKIFTQFEPICARKCYPCFDEPKFRVIYNTSIQINDPSFIVLYNTDPFEIIRTNTNNILYKFKTSVQMPTYVSAFIIGKFKYIEKYCQENIRIRIYTPHNININLSTFALDTSVKIMNFLINYFQTNYSYNKIDFVPINNTDVFGMENYGLIFCISNRLLYHKQTSTLNDKIQIVNMIAHELIHQWFGNLISINKWDNLWLKESFARFFEYETIKYIFPQWDCASNFTFNIIKTLEYDSISKRSIKTQIKKLHHIYQIYDQISYDKGATMLLMLQNYLGNERFMNVIRKFINQCKNTVINSYLFVKLFSENYELIEVSNMNGKQDKYIIQKIICSFIKNQGVPIIQFVDNNIIFDSFNIRQIINNKINHKSIKKNINKWYLPMFKNIVSNDIEHINIPLCEIPINNKSCCYCHICYNKQQYEILFKNIKNINSMQQLSIFYDLYVMSIYSPQQNNYWIHYLSSLIDLLISYNKQQQYNFYLFNYIDIFINKINKLLNNTQNNNFIDNHFDKHNIQAAKQNFDNLLFNKYNVLINKLFSIFNINNISTYTDLDLHDDNIHRNKIIFYLLDNYCDNLSANNMIEYMISNKQFNLYGDLNNIFCKYLILHPEKYSDLYIGNLLKENTFLNKCIFGAYRFTDNKKYIDNIFVTFKNNINIDHHNMITLLNNTYFHNIFVEYFIDHYNDFIKIVPLCSLLFTKYLHVMIININDINLMKKLFKKLDVEKNDYFSLVYYQSKHILFSNLYKNINIIKQLIEI